MNFRYLAMMVAVLLVSFQAAAAGTLTDNIRIESGHLGYALQFRVYVPEGAVEKPLPTLYVTDGQWYLGPGQMAEALDRLIEAGEIAPVLVVFVDSDNPDNPKENRRNDQYMCNRKYALFFRDELIPTIAANFQVGDRREDRVIMGLSFGGTNAACFGLMIPDNFTGIAMQSPANDQHLKLLSDLYGKTERLPLDIYFSVGTKKDNTGAARKFRKVLERKGYDFVYREVPFGHEWNNWRPLIPEILMHFFPARRGD